MTKEKMFSALCKRDKNLVGVKHTRDLLQETRTVLSLNDIKEDDVLWVGDVGGNICMSFSEFARHAEGFVYRPRGRCMFLVRSDDKQVSYFDDEEGIMNRIPPDLIVCGQDFFLRRFIHIRVTESDAPRNSDNEYNESPEYWEFVRYPKRNTPMLVDNSNMVRVFATDNISMARNLVTLNTDQTDGDPEFVRFSDMDRKAVSIRPSRSGGVQKRKIG